MTKPNNAIGIALNVLTLGGHGRIKDAQCQYDLAYGTYAKIHQVVTTKQERLNTNIVGLGEITRTAFKTLALACDITSQRFQPAISKDHFGDVSNRFVKPKADLVLSGYHSAWSVAKGLGAGATAGIGSWSLVSLVGIASTGTPIVGLAGAAATNAILACFGGGALAAGGAGMAGGAIVLGTIVAAPMIVVSVWTSHSKANQIHAEIAKIKEQENALKDLSKELDDKISATLLSQRSLSSSHHRLHECTMSTYHKLFPYAYCSKVWRALRDYFGLGYYTYDEVPLINTLVEEMEIFSSQFNFSQDKTIDTNKSSPHTIELVVATAVFVGIIAVIYIVVHNLLLVGH